MVRTGSHGYIQYAWESTFATDAGSSAYTKPFGLQQSVGSISLNNSRKDLRKLNQVERAAFAYGQQSGSVSVDFILSNPWLFKSVYGTASTSGSSAPYTHTFPHASNGQPKTVTTFSTEVGFAGETENISRKLLGCILTSFSISTAVDDLVNCSADITFGNEGDATTSLDSTPAADDINFPYTFAHGALKWYNGSSLATVAEIQNITANFTQNANLLYSVGAHKATSAYRQGFDLNGTFQTSWKDNNMLQQLVDQIDKPPTSEIHSGSSVALELKFTNGGSGAAEKSITVNFYGVTIDSHNVDGIVPVEPVFETINWEARGATVVAINGESTAK